jgi:hypothetical protein
MKPTVDFFTSAGRNVIITDVRYENEIDWIQQELKGSALYISREGILPANEEEEQNCPTLKNKSDLSINWKTFGEEAIEQAKPYVEGALKVLKLI